MKNDKHKLLSTAKDLRGTLKTIETLLEGYDGKNGNENYVKYCLEKSKQANVDDEKLNQLYDDTYNENIEKRKAINVATLYKIVERFFKLLDDIDTAGDMFKPNWCKITSAVEGLQRLRWLYCVIEGDNKDDNGVMEVNGDCYTKEGRTVLVM